MNKNEEVLSEAMLRDLLRSGMGPQFRSFGGILQDAANQGSLIAYRELVSAGRVNAYSSAIYESITIVSRLSDADDRDLLNLAMVNATAAIQQAARLGYNRFKSQR